MRSFLLHRSRFLTTVNHLKDLPATVRPEVAFAGRSNAGKSTAINILCNQKRLAFASKTPGRTQHINYFSVGPQDEPVGYLVDLPGYGYAQVSGDVKFHWQHLLSDYLHARHQLRGLVLLMDARRPCTELDMELLDWFAPTRKPIHVLLTKSDKLTRQESTLALRSTQKVLDDYEQPVEGAPRLLTVQLFSSLKRVGLEQAHDVIEHWIAPVDRTQTETSPEAPAGQ
ncbi:ribosome biogenesis GTP-binding protein YihA/YsxC [Pararobbsia silviterrae]|uniref:Probable GTP-binding protein EngB n=1 Tax=Pararobbsia silviterrae TaxID=1792498 RepID=A0A494XC33_9BURK|nr:ribosome biogenesis GTP-binding protein YihA/YsxC [Pararobbsia silviterrae]RKP45699.1 YihA family ribosome biogenesis GTP-binding protein [Pararobbsia silviterrae]